MSIMPSEDARDRASRWLEDGRSLARVLLEVFDGYDRLRGMAEAAERECERLRDEVNRLQAENDHLQREREEIGEALSKLAGDVLVRSRDPEPGDRRSVNSQGKVTYLLRPTRPGVAEFVERAREERS